MKIWIVLDHADQSDDIGIYAYSTKAEAETCFRKRLEEYVTLYGKFEDSQGRTMKQCIQDMHFDDGADDWTTMKEVEVGSGAPANAVF